MADCSGSDQKLCDYLLKIVKSAHLSVHGSQQAAQARFEQFMLLLKALSEELEEWKWKELESEQTLWSLELQESDAQANTWASNWTMNAFHFIFLYWYV